MGHAGDERADLGLIGTFTMSGTEHNSCGLSSNSDELIDLCGSNDQRGCKKYSIAWGRIGAGPRSCTSDNAAFQHLRLQSERNFLIRCEVLFCRRVFYKLYCRKRSLTASDIADVRMIAESLFEHCVKPFAHAGCVVTQRLTLHDFD